VQGDREREGVECATVPVPSGHARHVAYGRPPATVGLGLLVQDERLRAEGL